MSTRLLNINIIFSFNSIVFIFKPCILYFHSIFTDYGDVFNFFPFREYTFLVCKQNVGAGINTLISVTEGLDPSIFCRKMEKARLMREEMDGKVVYFPPESAFPLLCSHFLRVLFPICTLTWLVNNYVFRQEKVKIVELKVQKTQDFYCEIQMCCY